MRRGTVHKLCKKSVRSKGSGDDADPMVDFATWKRQRWRTVYVLACRPEITPPPEGLSYSPSWGAVTCPACQAQRPRLSLA